MRNLRAPISAFGAIMLFLSPLRAAAQVPKLDILSGTPIGSWQLREQTTTKQDGSKDILALKTSRLADETRGGEAYLWIELEMTPTHIDKKGQSKAQPVVLIKVLAKRWVYEGVIANGVYNPLPYATEIIVQLPNKDPQKFYGKSLSKVADLLGSVISYQWTDAGHESITTDSGPFEAQHLKGSGDLETKILLRKFKIHSEGDFWLSTKLPFGLVKAEGKTTINDKPQDWTVSLKSFGTSGAVSQITKEPKDATGSLLVKIFGE